MATLRGFDRFVRDVTRMRDRARLKRVLYADAAEVMEKEGIPRSFRKAGWKRRRWDPGYPPLNPGGELQRSVKAVASDTKVVIGTKARHGGVHQFGKLIRAKVASALRFLTPRGWVSKKEVYVPKRPYLRVLPEIRRKIARRWARIIGRGRP